MAGCPRCWDNPCTCKLRPPPAEDDKCFHHFKCERCWDAPCTCVEPAPEPDDPDKSMHFNS